MTVLRVPYHLDEYLPDLDLPLGPARTITAELPAGDTWARLAVLYRLVAETVCATARTCPVVLSGDCTTSLGTMAGLQRAGLDPGIVWFDAHGDVQTLETTASGYLAGAAIGQVEVAAVDPARLPDGPLYVHVDLDVIDPSVLPGLRYPAPGGAAAADVAHALGRLLGTGRVAAVGIACTWRPGHDAAARIAPYLAGVLVNP